MFHVVLYSPMIVRGIIQWTIHAIATALTITSPSFSTLLSQRQKHRFRTQKKKQKQQEMKIEEAIWGEKRELDLPANRKTSKDAINKNSWGKVDVRHVPWLNLRPRFVHNISINAASLGISFSFIHVILNFGFFRKAWRFRMHIWHDFCRWF